MNKALQQQYDSLYASGEVVFGGGKPVEVVRLSGNYLIREGTVLDIGGGDGRNALYLADQGFAVSVMDISQIGLDKLQVVAKEKSLHINTKVSDVLTDGIDGMYDGVVLSFILHHLDEMDAKWVIDEVKKHTTIGRVNVIATFINKGGLSERNTKSSRFYPSVETLIRIYSDWVILELQTYKILTFARDKNGERMKNYVVAMIARKLVGRN